MTVSTRQPLVDIVGDIEAQIGGGGGGAVSSVNGRTGAVTLSKSDVSLSNVDNTSDAAKPVSTATQTALDGKQPLATVLTNTTAAFTTAQESKLAGIASGAQVNTVNSVASKTGAVTLDKADVGLGSVDNTSDLDKPVSTATQTALDLKYNASNPSNFVNAAGAAAAAPVQSVAGRSGVVTLAKADVGLSNVDNTADSAKPISTATQAALDAKAPLSTAVRMFFGDVTTSTNSSNTVWSDVAGSGITVTAGKTYRLRWKLRTYSAATTTGVGLRRVLTTAVGTLYGMHYLGMSAATAIMGQSSREGTNDQFIGAGNATNSTTASGTYEVEALFSCTTGGTFGLQMRSEINTSLATIDGDGSYWVAEEWNT